VALGYFGLGPDAQAKSAAYIQEYYGFLGEWAQRIAQSVATTADSVRDYVKGFAEAGVDEVVFSPTIGDLAQVDLLADIVFAGK